MNLLIDYYYCYYVAHDLIRQFYPTGSNWNTHNGPNDLCGAWLATTFLFHDSITLESETRTHVHVCVCVCTKWERQVLISSHQKTRKTKNSAVCQLFEQRRLFETRTNFECAVTKWYYFIVVGLSQKKTNKWTQEIYLNFKYAKWWEQSEKKTHCKWRTWANLMTNSDIQTIICHSFRLRWLHSNVTATNDVIVCCESTLTLSHCFIFYFGLVERVAIVRNIIAPKELSTCNFRTHYKWTTAVSAWCGKCLCHLVSLYLSLSRCVCLAEKKTVPAFYAPVLLCAESNAPRVYCLHITMRSTC